MSSEVSERGLRHKRRRPSISWSDETTVAQSPMDDSMDTGSGPSRGGREIQLSRPFRPARKQWSKPGWTVPKWQYNKLKTHILAKNKPKRTYQRGTYRRQYSNGSRINGMGPIVITGRGGYYTDKLKSAASAGYRALQRGIPTGTFQRLGQAAGGAMYGKLGAAAGSFLGGQVANIAGFGDYTLSSNSLMQLDEGQQVPSFGDMNHSIVVSHREFIQDISIPGTPATFTNLAFPINPGMPGTFPWLSSIASSFDQYEILGMIFEFKSTSSDFGTTTSLAMGSIILATEYDSADSNYASKVEMENAQYSTSCKPSVSCIHAIECDPSISFSSLKYVRNGGVPTGKDIRLYDHGTFQIATVGLPTGSSGVIGELWVSYQIRFIKPQLTLGSDVLSSYISSASYNASNYWGVSPGLDANNSFPVTVSGNVATIPTTVPVNTYFMVAAKYQFASQAIAAGLVLANVGLTTIDGASSNAGTLDNYVYTTIFRVTSTPATITLSNLTVATGQVVTRWWFTQLDKEVVMSAYGLT